MFTKHHWWSVVYSQRWVYPNRAISVCLLSQFCIFYSDSPSVSRKFQPITGSSCFIEQTTVLL